MTGPKRNGSSGYDRRSASASPHTPKPNTKLTNKQIDAMSRTQLMKAARSAFVANEIERDAKYGTGKFTGKKITEAEASRRFDLMVSGKSLATVRRYVKQNKALVSEDAMPKTASESKRPTATKRTSKATTNKTKNTKAARAAKAPRKGKPTVVQLSNGKVTATRVDQGYKVSVSKSLTKYTNGRTSFTARLWSEAKAFIADIAKNLI